MITVDSSILMAMVIFLGLVFVLNWLLFRPLLAIQDERAARTTGLEAEARGQLEHYSDLFNRYEASIRAARMEGYRHQEQRRAEALEERRSILERARLSAEALLAQSRAAIEVQARAARADLERDAREIAVGITAVILERAG